MSNGNNIYIIKRDGNKEELNNLHSKILNKIQEVNPDIIEDFIIEI